MPAALQLPFASYPETVPRALDQAGVAGEVARARRILVKPNLVNDTPFPVTTSPQFCGEVVCWLQARTRADIVIAEGCGDADLETGQVFRNLGYHRLARDLGVELLDLNHAPLVRLEHPGNQVFPHFYLPEIATRSLIVSLPVLKAHSLAGITGTLKNMMGFAPPEHYSGGGFWKKALFHDRMQAAIRELNRYVLPDFTLMDGSLGLGQYHLGGPVCDPPVNRLIAGTDPWQVDRTAAALLGLDPDRISHLRPPSA